MLRKLKFMMAIMISFVLLVSPVLAQAEEPPAEQITPTISAQEIPAAPTIEEPPVQFAPMSGSYSSALSDFLKKVTLEDGQDTIYDSSSPPAQSPILNTGTTYTLTILFEETNGGIQFEYDGEGFLTYQLPNGIKPSIAIDAKEIKSIDAPAVTIGEFSLDINGLVKVNFFDVDNDGNTLSGTNFIDHYATARFNFVVTIKILRTSESQLIDFSDAISVTVTVQEAADAELTISKYTVGDFNTETLTMNYIVYIGVPATSGPVTGINLIDDCYLHMKHLSNDDNATKHLKVVGDFKLVKSDTSVSFISSDAGTLVDGEPRDGSTKYKRFTVPLNLDLIPGDMATVTYTLKIDEAIFGESVNPSHWYVGGIRDGFIFNKITAEGKDSNGIDVTASSYITRTVGFNPITKAGALSNGNASVDWTVTIDSQQFNWDYRGITIRDRLDSNNPWRSGTNLVISLYNQATLLETYTILFGDIHTGLTWYLQENVSGFDYVVPALGQPVTKIVYTCVSDNATGMINFINNHVYLYDGASEVGYGNGWVYIDFNFLAGVLNHLNLLDEGGETFVECTTMLTLPKELYNKSMYVDHRLWFKNAVSNVDHPVQMKEQDYTIKVFKADRAEDELTAFRKAQLNDDSIPFPDSEWTIVSTGQANIKMLNFPFVDNQGSTWTGADEDVRVFITWKQSLDSVLYYAYNQSPPFPNLGDALLNMGVDDYFEYHTQLWWNAGASYAHSKAKLKAGLGLSATYDSDAHELDCSLTFHNQMDSLSDQVPPIINIDYNPAELEFIGLPFGTDITVPDNINTEPELDSFLSPEYIPYFSKSGIPAMFDHFFYIPAVHNDTHKTLANVDSGAGSFSLDLSNLVIYKKEPSGALNPWTRFNYPEAFDYKTWHTKPKGTYVFHYKLKPLISVDELNAGRILTHHAQMTFRKPNNPDGSSGIIIRSGSQRQSVDVQVGGVVAKNMIVSGSRASFDILVNPTGVSLTEGLSPVITVTDVMGDTLALYLSTLKVKAKEGDDWVEKALSPGTMGVETAYTYVYNGAENKITFYLPDSVALSITYDCQVLGAIGQMVDVSNSININGIFVSILEEEIHLVDASAGGGGSRTDLSVIKTIIDDTNQRLQGAKFALYGPSNSNALTPLAGSGIEPTLTVNDGMFYYYGSGITNANGEAVFSHQNIVPNSGWVFAILEIEAPSNYLLLSEPVLVSMGLVQTDQLPSGFNQAKLDDVQAISDNVTITNAGSLSSLPSTGGIGTPLFIMTGLFVLLASGFFFIKKYAFN